MMKTIKEIVETTIRNDERAGKDDAYLYSCVCKEYLKNREIEITPEINTALNLISETVHLGLPNYETVRRARAKLQSDCVSDEDRKKHSDCRSIKKCA